MRSTMAITRKRRLRKRSPAMRRESKPGSPAGTVFGAKAAESSRSFRVLLTTPSLTRTGGVAQYMRVIQPHFNNEVSYFTIGSRSENESTKCIIMRFISDYWRFAAALAKGGYDVVHLNPSLEPKALVRDGLLLLIAKLFRIPIVVFFHGWNAVCEQWLSERLRLLFRLVYGRADAMIVLGTVFKKKVERLGYRGRVFLENAPVEDDLLDWQSRWRSEGRRHTSGRFNVLFLARVEKEKGIYEALEAHRLLRNEHPSAFLTVAGDGSESTDAQRYVREQNLSGITFLGHVSGASKERALRDADAYLFPSWHEGLPLSVLEAMACGLPIVTSAVGSLADFFENERMGFIVDSRNPEVLASRLKTLLCDQNLCSRMSLFNYTYAREHFRASEVAVRIERIYRTVLGSTHETLLCLR